MKAQNALPYLIVDFVWGFWLLLRGWRWHVHADWQNCGCYLGQLLRCFYEVSCLATTSGMPQRLAFAESGCWHWLWEMPGPCIPEGLHSWHRSPCTHTSLHPFSSLLKSAACGRCRSLVLSLSANFPGRKKKTKTLSWILLSLEKLYGHCANLLNGVIVLTAGKLHQGWVRLILSMRMPDIFFPNLLRLFALKSN